MRIVEKIEVCSEVIRKHLDGLEEIISKVSVGAKVTLGWTRETTAREIQKQELVKLGILDGKLWP